MDAETRRAPEDTGTDSQPVAMGTIGFDWYLATIGAFASDVLTRFDRLPSFEGI